MTMEVSPTMELAWISMPPVIMTKVTNSEMMQMLMKFVMLETIDVMRKNFSKFAAPKIANSASRIRRSTNSHFFVNFFSPSTKLVFV